MRRLTRRQALGLFGTTFVAGCSTSRSQTGPPDWTVEDGPATATAHTEAPPAEGTWPMAKRDPAATASAPAVNAPAAFPLELQWTHRTGQHDMQPPVVTVRTLLAQTRSPDSTMAALEPGTGAERWSVTQETLSPASPALGSGVGFVTQSGHDVTHAVRAVDLADGTDRWRVTDVSHPDTDLVVVGDTVYGGLASEAAVFALTAGSGDQCFQLRLSRPSIAVRRLAIADGTVYAATAGMETDYPDTGHVIAFEPAAGEVRWMYDAANPVRDLAVSEGTVVATDGFSVVGLSTSDGELEWADRRFNGGVRTVAARDDTVLAGGNRQIKALESQTGEERWVGEFGGSRAAMNAGDHVFVAGRPPDESSRWGVAALDLESGATRWRHDLSTKPTAASVAAETFFVGTRDGRVLAFGHRGDGNE